MNTRWPLLLALLLVPSRAHAEDPVLPGDKEPLLRLEAGGPTSAVTALVFNTDGTRLYAAGRDKLIRVWQRDPRSGRFQLESTAYRVPIGPGLEGVLNTIAMSPNGRWLATAGKGVVRGGAGFREPGLVLPQIGGLTAEMRLDEGTIYLFDLKSPTGSVRLLRGHRGAVLKLAFAPAHADKPPLLVSAARDWDADTHKFVTGVRLWNPDKGEEIRRRENLGGKDDALPGLAVWHTGKELQQLAVALSWDDGRLRLWDVGADRLWLTADGPENNTAAYLPATGLLLAGSTPTAGQLQAWTYSSDKGPTLANGRKATFPTRDGVFYYPRALTLVASQPGGPLDLAAVVLRVPKRGEEYQLCLVDVTPQNFGALKARVVLWKGGAQVIALAAGSGRLAVAGNTDQMIQVYAIADLLNSRGQPQPLRSVGTTFRSVQFARRGQDRGLFLRETADGPRLLFDFGKRALTGDTQGWQPDEPAAPADWDHSRVARQVRLKDKETVMTFALLPAREPFKLPILAVAYKDQHRQEWLGLYNAATGDQLRQCTGHVGAISSLAFTAGGRLLASAAADQTVCIWSLTDLDQTIGRLGMLPGVAVDDHMAVVEAARPGPAYGKLPKGAAIAGLVIDGKPRDLRTPREFYDAILQRKPGQPVTLRLKDGKPPVTLTVGQGIDERKPLLSLFVTHGGRTAEREWIGWHPNGPYDASAAKTERLLGWHFNTGKAGVPPSFALADQYRKEYQKPGILKHLIARGSLTPALKSLEEETRPLPPPKLGLQLPELGEDPRRIDGRILVQRRALTLKLDVNDFPPEHVAAVQWQFDDGAMHDFEADANGGWSADLAPLNWTRGRHRLRVVLRSREAQPQQFTQELPLHYQPPPPKIEWDADWLKKYFGGGPVRPLVVRDKKFPIRGEVQAGLAGQGVKVSLSQDGQPPRSLPRMKFSEEIDLKPDVPHRIVIQALNDGALQSFEDLETTVAPTLEITYLAPEVPVEPPRIVTDKVVTPADEETVQSGRLVIVTGKHVQLRGRITATENLREATRDGKPLARFQANQGKDFVYNEELDLKPGMNEIRLQAKTKKSPVGSASVKIEYRPPLPAVVLRAPRDGLVQYEGDKDAEVVELAAELKPAADPHPFQAVVLLNDRELPQKPVINERAGTLTATVKLQPGENRLQLRLANQWQTTAVWDRTVSYRRPPRILKIDQPKVGAKPQVDIVAYVESATELPLTAAAVNGRDLPPQALTIDQKGPLRTTWKVSAADVPLEQGANVVTLRVHNADGSCRVPGQLAVTYNRPPPPKARIELQPRVDTSVRQPRYTVAYRVTSGSRLRRVQLLRGRAILKTGTSLDQKNSNGEWEVEVETEVPLEPGTNRLRVEAVNDGGLEFAERTVTYSAPPVEVVLEQLTGPKQPDPVYRLAARADGNFTVPRVTEGKLVLHGRVVWRDAPDPAVLKGPLLVRVWVNGFQQLPTRLERTAKDPRQGVFRVNVQLNQKTDNVITAWLPDLKSESSARLSCTVAQCDQPIQHQRLHLLIVGIGVPKKEPLVEEALTALQATPHPQKRESYQTPVFDEVILYPPLTGFVGKEDFWGRLNRIGRRMQEANTRLPAAFSDVVMVYFYGREAVTPEGHFLLTSANRGTADLQDSAINCERLAEFFVNTRGAKLLLLELAEAAPRQAPERLEQLKDGPKVGVLRSLWQGPALPPAKSGILSVWGSVMPSSIRFREGLRKMTETFAQLPRQQYEALVPDSLDFQVGKAP